MSQENVEIVRKGMDAWIAGDMDRLRGVYNPDVITRAPRGWPEPGPFVGRDATMEQLTQIRETFERNSMEPVGDFLTAGDRVLARVDWRGIGHGPEGRVEMTIIWTVRRGLIVGQEHFWDHAEALEAAGLSE